MNKFHAMEIKYNLFQLGKDNGIPVWDLMRVQVYNNFFIEGNGTHNPIDFSSLIQKGINRLKFFFFSFCDFIQFPFKRGRILFYEHTNDKEGHYYYDHISRQLICCVPDNDRVVINSLSKRP